MKHKFIKLNSVIYDNDNDDNDDYVRMLGDVRRQSSAETNQSHNIILLLMYVQGPPSNGFSTFFLNFVFIIS